MKIAFITRGAFGVIGGASSYMLPTMLSESNDVLVLSPENSNQKEKKIFTNRHLNVVKIKSTEIEGMLLELHLHLQQFKPDIVHIFQNPFCLHYLTVLPGLLDNAKWILDFRSPLLARNKKSRKRILMRYFLSQFYADHIFTHSNLTLKDNIVLKIRASTEVTFGIDPEKHRPRTKSMYPSLRYVYVGSISKGRKMGLLIKSFAEFVIENSSRITLDIFGDGEELVELEKIVNKNKWTFIKMHGAVNQNILTSQLQNYDVGIAYVTNDNYSRAPSLKSAEYAASGLSIIASDTLGHRDWEKRHGFRYYYFNNTSKGIKRVLAKKYSIKELDDQRQTNFDAVKKFEWKYLVNNKLMPVYSRLTGEKTEQ